LFHSEEFKQLVLNEISKYNCFLAFDAEGLAAHNKFRSIHGTPSLKIDTQLSRDCTEYAKVLANLGTLKHASGDFGENLAFKCGSNLDKYTGDIPVQAWLVNLLIDTIDFVKIVKYLLRNSI